MPKVSSPPWTAEDQQKLIDGIVRGQNLVTLEPILGSKQVDMSAQLWKMSGTTKGVAADEVVLPRKWKDRKPTASPDQKPFGWQEDVELVKWLFHHCEGLN